MPNLGMKIVSNGIPRRQLHVNQWHVHEREQIATATAPSLEVGPDWERQLMLLLVSFLATNWKECKSLIKVAAQGKELSI